MLSTLRAVACAAVVTLVLPSGAFAQDESFFSFVSDPGDYIGAGGTAFFTPDTSSFSAFQTDGNQFAATLFPFAGGFWHIHFAAPVGQPLAPGVYENATRWPFQAPGVAGLDISGDGRGCNMLTGRFEVLEALFGPAGYVERFRATFEQHCEGAEPALRGEILIVNPPPPPVLTLSIGVLEKGSVDRSGMATIRGTVTCSAVTAVSLFGEVRQQVTRFALAKGAFSAQIPCSPTPASWAVVVPAAGEVPFGPGYSGVTLAATAFDPNYPSVVREELSGAVRLSRSSR